MLRHIVETTGHDRVGIRENHKKMGCRSNKRHPIFYGLISVLAPEDAGADCSDSVLADNLTDVAGAIVRS